MWCSARSNTQMQSYITRTCWKANPTITRWAVLIIICWMSSVDARWHVASRRVRTVSGSKAHDKELCGHATLLVGARGQKNKLGKWDVFRSKVLVNLASLSCVLTRFYKLEQNYLWGILFCKFCSPVFALLAASLYQVCLLPKSESSYWWLPVCFWVYWPRRHFLRHPLAGPGATDWSASSWRSAVRGRKVSDVSRAKGRRRKGGHGSRLPILQRIVRMVSNTLPSVGIKPDFYFYQGACAAYVCSFIRNLFLCFLFIA